MAYTYDDFLTRLNASGLAGQFSEYDMETARMYPEFGISMLSLKQDYNNATTDVGRQMANTMAEQLRASYGNYAGGVTGSSYINLGRSPSDYESKYGSMIDDTMDRLNNYGDFSYGPAPTYESRWDAQMTDILDQMTNRQPYLYNLETDPVWSAYKKQYRREGQRATADTLAQVSAMTGGMPSSYAVTAAQQAGDYYNAQMTDIIPQLYQQAYERYLNEYTMKQNDLAAVQSMEQMDYGKYQDQLSQYNADRNLAYNQWQDQYNMLSNNLSQMQTQDQLDYGKFTDDLSWDKQLLQNYQDQQAAGRDSAAAQVEAIIEAGGIPSADLVAASGLSQEYVDVMAGYYARAAAASGSGSGGTGGGSGGGSGGEEYSSVFAQVASSGMTPEEYAYSVMGLTSATAVKAFAESYNAWAGKMAQGQTQGTSAAGRPFTDAQYKLFEGELEQSRDKGTRLNLLEDAYTRGQITEEQARALAKQYGITLY